MSKAVEIAVDIGGTFTDIVCLKAGELFATKVSSTPKDQSKGFIEGVLKVMKTANCNSEDIQRVVHGHTVALNAILQKKGVTTGILMTKGFEDTLVIGRQGRKDLYNLFADPDTPGFIASGRRRIGINERMDSHGNIVTPLDEEAVKAAVTKLKELYDVKAIAVCYLFSFLNPTHELRTGEIINNIFPNIWVSLSCKIAPIFREYERLVVTAFDAYVKPPVNMYLSNLETELARIGTSAKLQVIQSRGGITSAKMAKENVVGMIKSGPAAGVIGGAFVGEKAELDIAGYDNKTGNYITIDIGGTSTDVALVCQGKPLITTEARIDKYPLSKTMIDVDSIGAGGGSIARLNNAGGFNVGPESAGAEPGPACYGRGGIEPTVTDASVVLGFLNPEYFAAGELKLDIDAATKSIEKIAKPLGLDIFTAASGIHKVINSRIAEQIRLASIKRGYDPRDFYLVALGGAGPVHSSILAKELSIPLSIIPNVPGVLAALGLLVADFEHENTRTFVATLDKGNGLIEKMVSIFQQLIQEGNRQMQNDGIALNEIKIRKSADMRYFGQSYELEVPITDEVNQYSLTKAVENFHAQHELLYGYNRLGTTVEFVNLRTIHCYSNPPKLQNLAHDGSLENARKGTRNVYFGEFMEVPIYERGKLPPKQIIEGPTIIEQPDSTTVVYPGQQCVVSPSGILFLKS